jgi:hypothetical protein
LLAARNTDAVEHHLGPATGDLLIAPKDILRTGINTLRGAKRGGLGQTAWREIADQYVTGAEKTAP